ncbi:uncharacterized protein B0T23DRAFT_401375 [Neurospora hispaniola]|uniref:Uncharacterized protein n=1 Tax=Neurospora hispaniola TaxID=588809 RepID=A0AAJ0IGA4_9PEZI|nr:hypothetical protein B0T23DRAFT_401375 [Neurospora hispaniola]
MHSRLPPPKGSPSFWVARSRWQLLEYILGTKESARPNIDAPSPSNTPSMASSLRTTELPFRRMTVPHLNAPTLTGISVHFFFFAIRLLRHPSAFQSLHVSEHEAPRALSVRIPAPAKSNHLLSDLSQSDCPITIPYIPATNTPMRPRSHSQAGPKTAIEKSQTRSEEIVPLARPEKNKTSTSWSWAVGSPLPGIGSRATFIPIVSSKVP